jgi:hypothetical protein
MADGERGQAPLENERFHAGDLHARVRHGRRVILLKHSPIVVGLQFSEPAAERVRQKPRIGGYIVLRADGRINSYQRFYICLRRAIPRLDNHQAVQDGREPPEGETCGIEHARKQDHQRGDRYPCQFAAFCAA